MIRTRKYAIALLAMLLPSLAFASNLFDVPAGDVSMKVLGAIFGGLLDSGGGSDPLLAGIKMFNGGCLIIGGILAAYTILAGTLNTAHDGEMLGKKFSSVWIPVRYSVGTALVLPVVGGGYCVMQALVMWLVVQGIGLADGVWSAYMSNPTSAANTNVANARAQVLAVAQDAFRSSVCYQSYAKAISESSSLLKWGQYAYSKNQTPQGYVYGDASSSVRRNGCGTVNYPQDTTVDATVVSTSPSTNAGYLGELGTIFAPMDVSAINKAQNAQTDALVDKMDNLAKQVLATAQSGEGVSMTPDQAAGYYAQITQATDDYLKNVKSTADGLSTGDAYEKIKSSASNQGWILAGAWFTRIIQMNDRINKSVSSTATSDSTSPKMDSLIFDDAAKYLRAADLVLASAKNSNPTDSFGIETNDKATGGQTQVTSNLWLKIEAKITEAMTGVNLYELKNDARHPLIIANDLGNRLIATCKNIMLGLVAAILGAGIIGAVTGTTGLVGAVVSMMGWFVDVPVKLLMGVAMGTEYILPNMPFIIWIGCIVGWVLLVIEAIIAAPLWAIMHLHPNGDDLTGRGGNGYTLVLSLLLRPVLMIFGMEASIVISAVIGEFINKTFFEVFAQNTGSFTGLSAVIGLAMGTLVYFIVMFIFIRKCFSLMFQLPDQLLQWIGGPTGASLGQFAGEFSQAADKGANAGAALGGFAASAAAKGISKGGGKLGNYIDNKINKDVKNREGQDKALEGQAGEGAAAVRNQFDGMKADVNPRALFKNNYAALRNAAKNSEAYDAGLVGAINTDPQHGRNDFESAFAESAANDHAEYGGSPAQAATAIGQKLMVRNLGGGEFGSFTIPASRNAEGQIDGKRAKSVMATIGRMQSRIGADRTKDVLDRAAASGASGGELMKQAEAFYKEELAKPIEPAPTADEVDDQKKD